MSRLRKRKDREELQRALLYMVLWICVIFYAFVGGVWAGEQAAKADKPREPETVCTVEEPAVDNPSDRLTPATSLCTREACEELAVDNPSDRLTPATSLCTREACEEPVPDVCEDTYLIEGHALDFETQMLLYGACLEFKVDYKLALAVIEQETGYRDIMGDGGDSCGYMQVQRKWHEDRMELLGVTDLMDPESNFRVGCHFLAECIDRYGLEKGLGYYNGGVPAVTNYSREVLGRLN